jgi:hypothetical protein
MNEDFDLKLPVTGLLSSDITIRMQVRKLPGHPIVLGFASDGSASYPVSLDYPNHQIGFFVPKSQLIALALRGTYRFDIVSIDTLGASRNIGGGTILFQDGVTS